LIFSLCVEPIVGGGRRYSGRPVKGFGVQIDRQLWWIDLKLSWVREGCGQEQALSIFLPRVVVWGRSPGERRGWGRGSIANL
ncbi:hypothetical protein ON021_17410, partial [Microcoleus sp. HI-ES]|nr:hypothetical protein [Microcoleus sp. HI-ES]